MCATVSAQREHEDHIIYIHSLFRSFDAKVAFISGEQRGRWRSITTRLTREPEDPSAAADCTKYEVDDPSTSLIAGNTISCSSMRYGEVGNFFSCKSETKEVGYLWEAPHEILISGNVREQIPACRFGTGNIGNPHSVTLLEPHLSCTEVPCIFMGR